MTIMVLLLGNRQQLERLQLRQAQLQESVCLRKEGLRRGLIIWDTTIELVNRLILLGSVTVRIYFLERLRRVLDRSFPSHS